MITMTVSQQVHADHVAGKHLSASHYALLCTHCRTAVTSKVAGK